MWAAELGRCCKLNRDKLQGTEHIVKTLTPLSVLSHHNIASPRESINDWQQLNISVINYCILSPPLYQAAYHKKPNSLHTALITRRCTGRWLKPSAAVSAYSRLQSCIFWYYFVMKQEPERVMKYLEYASIFSNKEDYSGYQLSLVNSE